MSGEQPTLCCQNNSPCFPMRHRASQLSICAFNGKKKKLLARASPLPFVFIPSVDCKIRKRFLCLCIHMSRQQAHQPSVTADAVGWKVTSRVTQCARHDVRTHQSYSMHASSHKRGKTPEDYKQMQIFDAGPHSLCSAEPVEFIGTKDMAAAAFVQPFPHNDIPVVKHH